MELLYTTTAFEWHSWLEAHNAKEPGEIWLVFFRKATGKPSMEYEEAIDEAICFGWVDSIIKKIDSERYAVKFTPRKQESHWSQSNRNRVQRLTTEGRMIPAGLAKVQAAKAMGTWDPPAPARARDEIPVELLEALEKNVKARRTFEHLAPSHRRQYAGWIADAKRRETRERRAAEAVSRLEKGQRLGMK